MLLADQLLDLQNNVCDLPIAFGTLGSSLIYTAGTAIDH
jgi:hypothetical protein